MDRGRCRLSERLCRRQIHTVLSSINGTLLPRNWPYPYHPIHRAPGDHSIIQSHLIESWAMSWWGFEKGDSAMMVIVETPDDASYTFSHPAGGPTYMGPSWVAQLGRFGNLRSLRMCFPPKENYVDLAKRYRRYGVNSGLYVSLKEKIGQKPIVANLVDYPMVSLRILRNVRPGSAEYDPKNPTKNYHLTTFAENAERLRDLKTQGWQHLNVTLSRLCIWLCCKALLLPRARNQSFEYSPLGRKNGTGDSQYLLVAPSW